MDEAVPIRFRPRQSYLYRGLQRFCRSSAVSVSGGSERVTRFMKTGEAATEPTGVIWWLCFLGSQDPVYESISAIGEMLRERGQNIVMFGPAGDYTRYTGFTHFAVPFSVIEQGRVWTDFASSAGLPMTSTAVSEIVDAERLWGGAAPSFEAEFLVLRALAFWEKAFEIMRPGVILGWGTTVPFSRLMLRLAQITQTPAYAVERGMTVNTLMFSLFGQCQISNVGLRLPFISPLRPDDQVEAEWLELKRFYAAPKSDPLPASSGAPSGPVVTYLGGFDVGSGMEFDSLRNGDRLGGWIRHSVDGALAVAECLSRIAPGSTLRIKPHPATPFVIEDRYPGITVEMVDAEDFKDLIRACDVCITPISTTQIFGFFYDKPVVTLANSFFAGREVAYEVADATMLDTQLRLALAREGWAERLAEAKQLITALFREEFVGLDPADPCGVKILHLVEHLARFRNYQPYSSLPADRRIDEFNLFQQLASGRRTVWSRADVASAIGDSDWNAIEAAIGREAAQNVRRALRHTFGIAHDPSLGSETDPTIAEILADMEAVESERRAALSLEVETLRTEISRLTTDLADSEQQRQTLAQTVDTLVESEHREAERRDVLTHEIDALRLETRDLSETLEVSEHQRHSLQAQMTSLTGERNIAFAEAARSLTDAEIGAQQLRILGGWCRRHFRWQREQARTKLIVLSRAGAKMSRAERESEIDPVSYLIANPDVAASGFDPFLHWELYGREEGRSTGSPSKD